MAHVSASSGHAGAPLVFAGGRPTSAQLERSLEPYAGRCPVCRAPLRAIHDRLIGCEHVRELERLAQTARDMGWLA